MVSPALWFKKMENDEKEALELECWRSLTERAPLPAVVLHGAERRVKLANPAFCRLLDKAPHELQGRPFREILPEPEESLALIDRVFRTGQAEMHSESGPAEQLAPAAQLTDSGAAPLAAEDRPQTGHPVYASLLLWPICDPEDGADAHTPPEGVILLITETARFRRRAMEGERAAAAEISALADRERAIEARLRLLADSVPAVVWCADEEGRTTFVNQRWYRITGMTPEQTACPMGFLEALHPDDRQRVREAWEEALRTGGVYDAEYRVRVTSGEYRWHLARGMPMPSAAGGPATWFGTSTDIDSLKTLQQALIRTEKLASAGRMAATVAHEINNPLEAAINSLYLAETGAGLPEPIREHLRIAQSELMRVAQISRLSLGFYHENSAPAEISIPALLDSVVGLFQARILSKMVMIEKQYAKRLRIRGVEGELRQVFANLMANSLDAVDERGTIKLRVSSALSTAGEPFVRVTIADSGHGIAQQARQYIFEPFFTTKGDTGIGLGLWVTRQIVEKHGGSIRVHSRTARPRSGTVVSVLLPARTPAAKPAIRMSQLE